MALFKLIESFIFTYYLKSNKILELIQILINIWFDANIIYDSELIGRVYAINSLIIDLFID